MEVSGLLRPWGRFTDSSCVLLIRHHLFSDLMPYACTFEDCLKPDHLYSSRQEWFDHETQLHRREWYCGACKEVIYQKELMIKHLSNTHSQEFRESEYASIADWCERVRRSKQCCPLCPQNVPPNEKHLQRYHRHDVSGAVGESIDFAALAQAQLSVDPPTCPYCPVTYEPIQLRRHLAIHLQQLALFTLPRFSKDDEPDGSDNESRGACLHDDSFLESEGNDGKGLKGSWSSDDGSMSDIGSIRSIPDMDIPENPGGGIGNKTLEGMPDLELRPRLASHDRHADILF